MTTWTLDQFRHLRKYHSPHRRFQGNSSLAPCHNWTSKAAQTPTFTPSRKVLDRDRSISCRSSFQFIRRQYVDPKPELIPQRCSQCGGTGKCTCNDCAGRGRLSRAGYNKKNRVDMTRVVGSKWTAMQETMGWRHFRVIQCRKGASGVAFVHMQASCDPATQLWINASNLKDRDLWAAGWLQKSEMENPAGAMAGGVPCRACSGTGSIPCPVCDATGAVLLPPSGLGGPAESPVGGPAAAGGFNVDGLSSSTSGGGSDDGVVSTRASLSAHMPCGIAILDTGDLSGPGPGTGAAAMLGDGGIGSGAVSGTVMRHEEV